MVCTVMTSQLWLQYIPDCVYSYPFMPSHAHVETSTNEIKIIEKIIGTDRMSYFQISRKDRTQGLPDQSLFTL